MKQIHFFQEWIWKDSGMKLQSVADATLVGSWGSREGGIAASAHRPRLQQKL